MQEYVHYIPDPQISDAQRKIMIAQVDGLTVLSMAEKTIRVMCSVNTKQCRISKSCAKCEIFAECVRKSVENQIIER